MTVTANLKALALHTGRAQWAAETTLLSVQPWCLPISVLGMAGDDDLIWGLRVGRGDDGAVVVAGDPRVLAEQERVFVEIDRLLDPSWQRALDASVWPQIAVPSVGAVRLLALAATRVLRDSTNAQSRRGAQRMGWLAGRWGVPGQQSVIVATEELLGQVATGMTAHDDGHLGAVLEWLEPGAGGAPDVGTVEDRAVLAATYPAGTLALPLTERSLEDGVELYASDPVGARAVVEVGLGPVLAHQQVLLDRALRFLSSVLPGPAPAAARVVVSGTDVNALLERREHRLWVKHFGGDPVSGTPRLMGGLRVEAQALQDAEQVAAALRWCRAVVDCYAGLSTSVDGLTAFGTVMGSRWATDGAVEIDLDVGDGLRVDQSRRWRMADDLRSVWDLVAQTPNARSAWMLTLRIHAGQTTVTPLVGERRLLIPVDPLAELKRALAPPATGRRMWMGTGLHPRASSS